MPPVSSWMNPVRPDSNAPRAVVRTPRTETVVPSGATRASAIESGPGVAVGVGVGDGEGDGDGGAVGGGGGVGVCVAGGGGGARDGAGRGEQGRGQTLRRGQGLDEPVRRIVVGIDRIAGQASGGAFETRTCRRSKCGRTLDETVRRVAPTDGIDDVPAD